MKAHPKQSQQATRASSVRNITNNRVADRGWINVGHDLIAKSVREKVPLNDLLAPYVQRFDDPEAKAVVCGAISYALGAIDAALQKGAKFTNNKRLGGAVMTIGIDMNRAMVDGDQVVIGQCIRDVVGGFDGLLTAGWLKSAEATKPEPTKIEIVGMPARETLSAVTRNPNGEIVATTQTERDVN